MDRIIESCTYDDFLKLMETISIANYPEDHKIIYDENTKTVYIESKTKIRQDIIDFLYSRRRAND